MEVELNTIKDAGIINLTNAYVSKSLKDFWEYSLHAGHGIRVIVYRF